MRLKVCNHSASLVYQQERHTNVVAGSLSVERSGIWKVTPWVRTSKHEEVDQFPGKECHFKESLVAVQGGKACQCWGLTNLHLVSKSAIPHCDHMWEARSQEKHAHHNKQGRAANELRFQLLKLSEVGSRILWSPFIIPVEVSGTGPLLCCWEALLRPQPLFLLIS